MKPKLTLFVPVLTIVLLQLCVPVFGQKKLARQGKLIELNFRDFPSGEKVSNETWKKINTGKGHIETGYYQVFSDEPSTKYVEVVSKRNALENFYIDPADPAKYSLVKALSPVNFQRNGEWIVIDPQLRSMGNDLYEAPDQINPVGINVKTKESYITIGGNKVQFNSWTLYGENSNGKVLLAKADWSHYSIGADGIRITDIFPGIDAEINTRRGAVKASFIVHRMNYPQYEKLFFEDAFKGISSKGLHFDSDSEHAETIYAEGADGVDAFRITPALGYAKGTPSIVRTFSYHVEGNKLGIEVPVQYLVDNLVSGDVIIDPLVQSIESMATTAGSMYNASCNFINSCDYTIAITPPANATVTQIATRVHIVAVAPCNLINFSWRENLGTCESPGGGAYWYVGISSPGVYDLGYWNEYDILLPCAPAPSCTPAPISLDFHLMRGCVGPTGCDGTCVGTGSPLSVRIQGRTAELTPIIVTPNDSLCIGQNFTFTASPTFGVPPYSVINWSLDPSGTPSLGTGNSITTGSALTVAGGYKIYANATDACGTVATVNTVFTVLDPLLITAPGQTICNGATLNVPLIPQYPGTYDWTVVQTGATGASNGTGTSISHVLSNTGSTPGTVEYTVTLSAFGCTGPPAVHTVTVNPENRVLYVDGLNGNDANCGDSWTSSLKTVAQALKRANSSTNVDSILVAAGTYYPTVFQSGTNRDSSLVITDDRLKMYGGYPNGGGTRDVIANPTILSGDIGTLNSVADNSYHVMVIPRSLGVASDTIVVDGFTITKGYATGAGTFVYEINATARAAGGGIYVRDNGTQVVLRNLILKENSGTAAGGGISINTASPAIQNCTFINNTTGGGGGGLCNEVLARPVVTDCIFTGNTAILGGGAFNQTANSAPIYRNCSFINNTAGTSTVDGWGGGMASRTGAVVAASDCLFSDNKATNGGGGAYHEGGAQGVYIYCSFANNRSQSGAGNLGSGGGVQGGGSSNVQLINCVIANNVAGGTGDDGGGGVMVYSGSSFTCINTTISGNTTLSTVRPNAAGTSNMGGTTLNIRNSIVWGPGGQYNTLGAFNVESSIVKGYTGGTNNLNLDPLFTDASNPAGTDGVYRTADDGLNIPACSPAVNMGNSALAITPNDMSAGTRIVGTAVDMGAYELQTIGPNIVFTDIVKTYGDPDAAVPNVTSCSGLPLTFTIDDNNIATIVGGNLHVVNAGTTTITAHAPNGTPDVTVSLTVNPRSVTISLTATPIVKTYDGNTNATVTAANFQFAAGNIIGGDNVVITLSSNTGSYDTKDVGTGKLVTVPLANITLTGTSRSNYVISNTIDPSATVGIINQRQITVTAALKTKTYGDTDPALTYTFTPALAGADAFTGSLTRAPGENVGVYPISRNTLALSSNYTIVYVGNNFTITRKTISVIVDFQTKIYGDADPALTYTYSPALVGTDAFVGSLTRVAGENAGVYPINQGTLALNGNYLLNYTGNNLNISTKAITVRIDPKTKVYGDPDPPLTYTFSPALVGTDAFSGALTRAPGEDVGSYLIVRGTLALSLNYSMTIRGVPFVITPKAITATAQPKTKVYGDVDPVLTYTFAPVLIGTDAFTGGLTRIPGENIGTYAINQGTLTLSANYTLAYVSNNLTITPKAITVNAVPKTKTYGDADPALTYTYSPALVGTDAFAGSLTRVPGENVGTYAINQGTLALSTNYTLTYVSSNLTIITKVITVTAAPKTKTYGDADPALTYTYAPALVGTDAFTGSLTRVPGQNVGTYPINQGTLTLSANYTLTYVGNNLTITPKAITVTAVPKTKIYGAADPALTYTYSPALVGTDAFTGALTRAPGENVGTYAINQGTLTLSANYTLTYIGSNLTITPKLITVTAVPKTKVYGDADPALTYTYTPALVGTDVFTGTLTRVAGENVGTYAINQGTLALSTNYTLTYVSGDFVITKAVLTVTANDKIVCLTDPVTGLTVTYAGFKFTDNASSLSVQPRIVVPPYNSAGTYVLMPTGGSAMNYSFNYLPGQLTVLPVPEGNIVQVPVGPPVVNTPGVNSGMNLIAPQGTGYTYQWNTGAQTGSIFVRDNGIYSVRVTNPQGCWQVFSVLVKQQTLIIPNIFSPNGDGINDKWVIENLQNYPGSIVQIYNRYGQAVYKMVNYMPWNGQINGKEMPIGTYYYIIDLKNGQKPISGYIDIIR
jgi:gliding motility-associated-like protein